MAYSETLMRPPNSGEAAKYRSYHRDVNFPVTKHTTLYGSGLEWVSGELNEEEEFVLAKGKESEFIEHLAEDRLQTVEEGASLWFGDNFVHRATSTASTAGYIVTSTSPAVSMANIPGFR